MESKKKTIKSFIVSLFFLLLLTLVEVVEVSLSTQNTDAKTLFYVFVSVFTMVLFRAILKPAIVNYIESRKNKEPIEDVTDGAKNLDNHDLK